MVARRQVSNSYLSRTVCHVDIVSFAVNVHKNNAVGSRVNSNNDCSAFKTFFDININRSIPLRNFNLCIYFRLIAVSINKDYCSIVSARSSVGQVDKGCAVNNSAIVPFTINNDSDIAVSIIVRKGHIDKCLIACSGHVQFDSASCCEVFTYTGFFIKVISFECSGHCVVSFSKVFDEQFAGAVCHVDVVSFAVDIDKYKTVSCRFTGYDNSGAVDSFFDFNINSCIPFRNFNRNSYY